VARRTRKPVPPLTRSQKIAFIAGPLVLAPIIVVGIIVENRSAGGGFERLWTTWPGPPAAG
jgi:hypothetical protein